MERRKDIVNAATSKTSKAAIWSLILGIISPITIFLSAIPAIILGIVAIIKISKNERTLKGKGLAISGIIISASLFVLCMIIAHKDNVPELRPATTHRETLKGYTYNKNRTLIPYEIIKTVQHLPYGKSFRIMITKINGRYPDEEQLADILNYLKNQEPATERTFVYFYLPGMSTETPVGSFFPRAWANADYDPNLEVRIFGMTNELSKKFADISNTPEFKAWEMYNNESDRVTEEAAIRFGGLPSDHLYIGQKLRLESGLPVFPYINGDDDYREGYVKATRLPSNTEIEIVQRIEQGIVYYKIKLPDGLLAFCMSSAIIDWYDTDERKKQRSDKLFEWQEAKDIEIKNKYFASKGLNFDEIDERATNEEWSRYLSR